MKRYTEWLLSGAIAVAVCLLPWNQVGLNQTLKAQEVPAEQTAESKTEKKARAEKRRAAKEAKKRKTSAADNDGSGQATKKKSAKKGQTDNRKKKKSAANKRVTGKMKSELMAFVKKHHPELRQLLNQLEERHPDKHAVALRSLYRKYERVQRFEDDPEKHESALMQWKLNSRIDLAAAQVSLKDSPEVRNELKQLVSKRLDARQEQLVGELARARQRIERIESQLDRLDTDREAEVERQINAAMKAVRNMSAKERKNAKPKADGDEPQTRKRKKKDKSDKGGDDADS